jgi:hypothetical protein
MLTLVMFAGNASAQTVDAQQACTNDAFRLCERAIPDEAKVKGCLLANLRRLSPACKKVFARGRRR